MTWVNNGSEAVNKCSRSDLLVEFIAADLTFLADNSSYTIKSAVDHFCFMHLAEKIKLGTLGLMFTPYRGIFPVQL